MPGTFARIKVWVRERLKYADLNAEFNNILNNMTPTGVDDASSDVSAMRAEADPIPSGTESLATNLLGEIQRIRAVLRRIQGGDYWYSDAGTVLSANPRDLVAYGPSEGTTTSEALVDYLQRRGLLNALSLSSANIAVSDFNSANPKFGNYAMSVNTSAIWALMAKSSPSLSLSAHFRNLAAGDYIAYNPSLGIELYLDGSGFLTARVRLQTAASETAKNFSTVAGSVSRAASTSYQHVVMRNRVNGAAGAGTDLVHLLRDGADEGTQINAATLPIGVGASGPWFIGARPLNPTWDHFSAMSVNPDAEASSPWSLSTSGAPSRAVSGGLLTISTAALESLRFTRTSGVDLANMTIDTKFRVSAGDINYTVLLADVYDSSMSRGLSVFVEQGRLVVASTFIGSTLQRFVPLDATQWNHIRITSLGSPDPTVRVYINGVQVLVFTNDQALVIGADAFDFGLLSGTVTTASAVFEHYSYTSSVAATVYPPIQAAPSSTGQVDDLAVFATQLPAAVVTALSTNAVSAVYRTDRKPGLYVPPLDFGLLSSATDTEFARLSSYVVSDGQTPISLAMLGHISTTLTPAYVFDARLVQGFGAEVVILHSVGVQYVAAGVFNPLALSAKKILPLGVHNIAAALGSFDGSDTVSGRISLFAHKGSEV